MLKNILIVVSITVCSPLNAKNIFKYKDANGEWVFSDKKPLTTKKVETVVYKNKKKQKPKPKVFVVKKKQGKALIVKNPLYAPIEIKFEQPIYPGAPLSIVIPAASNTIIYEGKKAISKFRYSWVLGNPNAVEDSFLYQFPVASKQSFKITQSFHGRFSHTKMPNIYAVDIAMRFGTYIGAARGGIVIWVKDDYHLGGQKDYFIDKANYVKVLHEDGTYAVYAHILEGSALVKAGDKVVTGDIIARSGSSGYSSGPHLHFVIRKNNGLKSVSIPFEFINNEGERYTPRRGMDVLGYLK